MAFLELARVDMMPVSAAGSAECRACHRFPCAMGEPAQGTVELLEELPAQGPLWDDWRQLATNRESVFATPDWCRAWFAVQPSSRPFVLVQ